MKRAKKPSAARTVGLSGRTGCSLADLVPTNWLDPLLTGPDAVIGEHPYDGYDIENLLRAVKKRIADAEQENPAVEGRREPTTDHKKG